MQTPDTRFNTYGKTKDTRLVRVSKRRRISCLGLSTVDPARHFHSDLTDSAHFGVKRPSGTPQGQKHHSSKSRVDWTFLQILVQSRKTRGSHRPCCTRAFRRHRGSDSATCLDPRAERRCAECCEQRRSGWSVE